MQTKPATLKGLCDFEIESFPYPAACAAQPEPEFKKQVAISHINTEGWMDGDIVRTSLDESKAKEAEAKGKREERPQRQTPRRPGLA